MTAPPNSQTRRGPPHIATLILMSGLAALVMNIFLPSLPRMAEYYQADYASIQLSVALYLGASGVLQIFIGPLADKIGRRPVALAGVGLFMLATLGCLFAPTVEIFLFFRITQAIVVVCQVLGRAVVRDIYPEDKAASMLGYVTMGIAVIPMMAPALGGALDEMFDWQASFWLQFILGGLTLGLIWFDMGETGHKSGKSLMAQFAEYPELLCSPRFWGYSLAIGASSGAFFSFLGGAPFVGSVVFALSPTELGFYFGAPAIGYFTGNFLTGRYAVRVGINRMVLIGSLVVAFGMALALALFALGLGSAPVFFGCMIFVGLGNGTAIPNGTAGMLSVRPHLAATASGLGGAIMLGGGAALSALAGALLTPETGAWPLMWLMLATALLSLLAIGIVIARERQLRL
ncbi:multidrug effflux MFS transporter [Pontibaca salina]|uniref:Bcr/CflA family efflux transporter n=1 Tax=Pontibaca salina TaxID=2795731 RepID=A0A934M1G2_9RHOB|nr:multidrug effflux MFS transporter [Pontibaca salina]MBI6629621.1 multidrug effflux MFS transporter [Pontibaca salina]